MFVGNITTGKVLKSSSEMQGPWGLCYRALIPPVSAPSLWPKPLPGDTDLQTTVGSPQPALWMSTLFCLCDSPGRNTGVGRHALLQGIFPTQGLNSRLLCLLHCRQIFFFFFFFLPLSHQGSLSVFVTLLLLTETLMDPFTCLFAAWIKRNCSYFWKFFPKRFKRFKYFLPLQLYESENRSVVSDSLRPHGQHNPWTSPGQNTGAGSLSLPQWIFSTQGSNQGLQHCRQMLYQLRHQGSPNCIRTP